MTSKLGSRLVGRARAEPIPGGTLDPTTISKYERPLIIPPAMPKTSTTGGIDYYEIAVRQFQQEIVPGKSTTVWSYGSANHPATFNYPAFTIEARWRRPVRVKWINDLVDANGNYLPHILSVDQTLHWANPPGGVDGRDMHPHSPDPNPYTGPVPIVTHVHGSHATAESDGYAEAWYLPDAGNIPAGYATEGTWFNELRLQFLAKHGVDWDDDPGSAVFQYPNDQVASTLWYHDHTLGMTRLNVYAGPAGFYILRGGLFDLPTLILPKGQFEIPIAIQDRSFNGDGSLFYPETREFFDGASASDPGYIPATDISPIWNPEFFGNTMVVNGRTWPRVEVQARRYRFRFLNGCNSRFLILKMLVGGLSSTSTLPFWRIGAEGGFLPKAVQQEGMLMSPAERADVIVDFTELEGQEVYLINEGPDAPFGGLPVAPEDLADPATTGQVMKFVVGPRVGPDLTVDPDKRPLFLPSLPVLGPVKKVRKVGLGEVSSTVFDGPVAAVLQDETFNDKFWADPITENPALNTTEIWEIHNHTVDAHPIHVHEVMFDVLDRQSMVPGSARRPAEPCETGAKDTVIAYPGEITRIKARFDLPGRYVWHCHIVEHEDNEMMRPYHVGPGKDMLPRARQS